MLIKDKIPPIKKKGAKGIYFCFFFRPQIIPIIHDITIAIASPVIPNQIPPAANSFTSPIPIGENSFFCFFVFSKIKPITVPTEYPNAAAMAESDTEETHGKNVIINNPRIKNGNK